MQGLLNNVTGGMAWAEGYSLALSLLFFLPAIIAFLRGHPRRWAIVVLLLALGWTVVGWWVALIWSLSATRR
ncbi:MAG: superinfection immunity protein [Alphaproteobacteria bacterium]